MTDQQQENTKEKTMTIPEMKVWACSRIRNVLSTKLMEERLTRMAGGDISRVAKYLTSFLAVIMEDDGGSVNNKKFYCQCNLNSLVTCFLESFNMQLPFDSRKLVSMVIYDWAAELDISYKGFINALCKHYDNAYVDAKVVMMEDEFECTETAGKVVFRHKAADPFAQILSRMEDVRGAYCYFTYTLKGGEKIERMVRISKADLWLIRSKAKTTKVWDEFTSEQIIKAIIRRAAKIPFAAIDLEVDIEEVNNRHFDLTKTAGSARLEKLMDAQEAYENKTLDPTPAAEPENKEPAPEKKEPAENETAKPAAQGADPAKDEPPAPKDISDADFEEVGSPAAQETRAEAPAQEAKSDAWDGKTISLGAGQPVTKDFADAAAGVKYLKAVIERRKSKVSRKAIIDANVLMIGAAIRGGHKTAVDELHQLADKGE